MSHFPVHDVLPELIERLVDHSTVILSAPPGSGKTTQVPLELLRGSYINGRIVILQPRRVAARSVATWMAHLLGERVGERIGYQVRHERRLSSNTHIEVLTEGLLMQRLLIDPELNGIGLVILDEFHERSVLTDLTLMMLREAQILAREDLKILIMSATLDEEQLSQRLSAPIVHAKGRSYPLEISYLQQTPKVEDLAQVIARELNGFWLNREHQEEVCTSRGHCLVFLPGQREIEECEAELRALYPSCEVSVLYGALSLDRQRRALDPSGRPRVILSTNIAETSLTIEGVTHVIDSGLYRSLRVDHKTGLSQLMTLPIATDSATQRAGRAGRTQAGRCLRLWTKHDHKHREQNTPAEVSYLDLTSHLLKVTAWAGSLSSFEWFEPPSERSLSRASEHLIELNALSSQGGLTELGSLLIHLPLHPQRGLALLWGLRLGCLDEVAFLCALAELPRDPLCHLTDRLNALNPWHRWAVYQEEQRGSRHEFSKFGGEFHATVDQLKRQMMRFEDLDLPLNHPALSKISQASIKERVAFVFSQSSPRGIASVRERSEGSSERIYHLSGGGEAQLSSEDLTTQAPLLVALRSRLTLRGDLLIELALPINPEWLSPRVQVKLEFNEELGGVYERKIASIGELILWERSHPARRDHQEAQALFSAVLKRDPWRWLNIDEEAQSWLMRARWFGQWLRDNDATYQTLLTQAGSPYPDWHKSVDRPSLEKASSIPESPLDQLIDHLSEGTTHIKQIKIPLKISPLLNGLTPSVWVSALESYTPPSYLLPTGQSVKVRYELGHPPSIQVYLQALFGEVVHPALGDLTKGTLIPLQLHLLAPNQRVTQITSDLPGFWTNSYPEVRKQLRGRYPKHHWPEDPLSIGPQRGAKRRVHT